MTMRCKKHLQDLTSTIGVCASCLCERLQPLLAAQAKAQAQIQAQSDGDNNNNKRHRKPKPKPEPEPKPEQKPPPTFNFPRSVSPYETCRKSDYDRRRERLFYGTPQATAAACGGGTKKRSGGRFWILSTIFRGKSNKAEFSSHEDSRGEEPSFSASPPSSWFSTILHTRRHADRHMRQRTDIESSKLTTTEENYASSDETHDQTDSGNSSESSPAKQKPTAAVNRRSRLGLGGKGVTSIAFCLSPLVRASPNRHWSHKGLAQELGAGGTHHMSTATASFCANRSRKMADFGRVAHNR